MPSPTLDVVAIEFGAFWSPSTTIANLLNYYSEQVLHTSFSLMAFRSRPNDIKSPQVSRTLLSILANFNNVVDWMVSTRSSISNSSNTLDFCSVCMLLVIHQILKSKEKSTIVYFRILFIFQICVIIIQVFRGISVCTDSLYIK